MTYGAKSYKQTQIMTASPGQILIMLYEGAIQNIKKAIQFINQNDLPQKGLAIGKAHDIINELLNSLDMKTGGKIAEDLEALYLHMVSELIKANMNNDTKPLESVCKNLETLLDGWRVAVSQVQQSQATKKAI